MRSVLRIWTVAYATYSVDRLAQHRLIRRPVRVVAGETGHPARIHEALHEVVTLHAVFVSGTVGEMGESERAQLMRLELPKVGQVQPDVVPHRPVVISPLDRILKRLSLGMALDARVIGMHIVHSSGIDDVVPGRTLNMGGPRAMTALAADVPFRDTVVFDFETNRVAAIT